MKSKVLYLKVCYLILQFVWVSFAYAAASDSDKWQIYLSDSITYDDNLFRRSKNFNSSARLPSDASRSDIINSASLTGLLYYKFSRQKLLLKGQVDSNQYVNNTILDHVSTNNRAVWQWSAGKSFSGDAGYNYRVYQSRFINTDFLGNDLVTENMVYANGQYALNSSWRIRGGLSRMDAEHSEKTRNSLNQQFKGIFTGIEYISPSSNKIGLEYSLSETTLPNQEVIAANKVDNNSTQQNIAILFSWQLLQKTHIDGYFGFTEKAYSKFRERDFSGYTGNVAFTWETTAKTALNLTAWRQLINAADITANYIIGQGFRLTPTWKIRSKLNFTGQVSWESRDYAGDPGLVSRAQLRQDEVFGGQIGLRFSPVKNADFEINYSYENRFSNRLGADYNYSSLFANATLKF